MNILHTCEFYSPSVGGAQEVVKQISERLFSLGHNVTVATTHLKNRQSMILNGVKIEEFDISGNAAKGMQGETERYQKYLLNGKFDIMMNYAAQQWTMDAAFPVLEKLPYKKVMIPCGFSGLFNPRYSAYFLLLPFVMKKYDHLVFHANDYRDINFARQNGISHFSIIPNGAAEDEFCSQQNDFRQQHHIPKNVPLLLTVGSHTGIKGHHFVMKAFRRSKIKKGVLVIIGNIFTKNSIQESFYKPLLYSIKHFEVYAIAKLLIKTMLRGIAPGCLLDCRREAHWTNFLGFGRKKVLLLDPPRPEVISAYQAADLFVFGSNLEYSPLVLFEAAASHTPFITLECGNAREIVEWTGGGLIAPTIRGENGFVNGSSIEFAKMIDELLADPLRSTNLAESGFKSWKERFTWKKIALQYETLYKELLK